MARHHPEDQRRRQLIAGTITVIARRGLVATTLADVARAAKVSYGVVAFYFKTKDALLLATLDHLAAEYEAIAASAAAKAGPSPIAKLVAVLDADFSPVVASVRKVAAWTAFWAECRATPKFRRRCIELEDRYFRLTRDLCGRIIEDGGHVGLRPDAVAAGLNAMVSGLWLDMHIRGTGMSRTEAKQVTHDYLATLFPREMSRPGRKAA